VGPLLLFIPPEGPGIRVDSGVQSGDNITIHYDPLIAKLIVYDSTREGAMQRMQKALRETVVLGTTTNVDFLRALLAHPTFAAGEVYTSFIEENLDALVGAFHGTPLHQHHLEMSPPQRNLDIALIAAALHDMENGSASEGTNRRLAPTTEHDPWTRADGFRMGRK
jgi:acetyl/propionyl-CoA carboxylase alpha subunit